MVGNVTQRVGRAGIIQVAQFEKDLGGRSRLRGGSSGDLDGPWIEMRRHRLPVVVRILDFDDVTAIRMLPSPIQFPEVRLGLGHRCCAVRGGDFIGRHRCRGRFGVACCILPSDEPCQVGCHQRGNSAVANSRSGLGRGRGVSLTGFILLGRFHGSSSIPRTP
jgi:hypothetical protein